MSKIRIPRIPKTSLIKRVLFLHSDRVKSRYFTIFNALSSYQPRSVDPPILLADHFRINANEFLTLAGWPTLKAFEIQAFNQEQLFPEVVEVALSLAKVSNPGIRKDAAAAFLTLINNCINQG